MINPVQIWKSSLTAWMKNLVPLVAFSGVMMAAHMGLKAYVRMLVPSYASTAASDADASMIAVFGVGALVLLCVNSFLSLALISYVRAPRQGRPHLFSALKDAGARVVPFLKSLLLLWAFVFVGMSVAAMFLAGGKVAYSFLLRNSGSSIALGVLLATSTVFVVLTIAVAWYSFFFSLGPLVAAFEHLAAVASLRASRDRVRGQAIGYLVAMAGAGVFYFVVGLGLYALVTRFTHDRFVLDLIDPLVLLFFVPLALVAWYACYKKLTEMKRK